MRNATLNMQCIGQQLQQIVTWSGHTISTRTELSYTLHHHKPFPHGWDFLSCLGQHRGWLGRLHGRVWWAVKTTQSNTASFNSSVERHPGSHWFCFTLLCDWSRNVAPLSQPIKDKTKTNHVLVAVFSRALVGRGNCSSFGFYDTQSKSFLERFSTTFREINTRVIITANQKTDPYRKELIRTKK